MPRASSFAFSRSARRLLGCLLACLLPLHGLAAGVIAVAGPAHTHQVAASRLVLEDFRRAPVAAWSMPAHVATALGHFHGAETPLRHHHAPGDGSVVLADGAALQSSGDGDDLSLSPTLAVFVALLPDGMASPGAATDTTTVAHAPWSLQTHCPALPERPPRALA